MRREYSPHLADAPLIAWVGGGEGGKVVLPFNDRRGRDHGRFVQRVRVVMHVWAIEWQADLIANDSIFVGLRDRMIAGMELGGDLLNGAHPDRRAAATG